MMKGVLTFKNIYLEKRLDPLNTAYQGGLTLDPLRKGWSIRGS
jgi:hypothetical protein